MNVSCIGPRVLSAMLCVRFAQSMARHSTQVKQAFLYRVFWAVRWAMKPRGCSKSTTRAISIEATDETPYLQIGEHKYGKPILDRVVHPEMRLGEVAKLILLSFDATLRSNLSVGMPIDLLLYERDTLDVRRVRRIDENDDYYRKLSNQWAKALRAAVASMDEYKD